MAILSVYRTFDESGTADGLKTEEQISFLVEVDDSPISGSEILGADDGITSIPSVNELVGSSRVTSQSYARDTDNPNHYKVTCKLSDAAPEQSQGSDKVNVDIKVKTVKTEEVVYLDRNKKPIVNAAGQPFSNQPTKTYFDEQITVSFNTGKVDQTNIDKCKGTTNTNAVKMTVRGYPRTFEAGSLKFDDYSVSSQVTEGGEYTWNVEYIFMHRKDLWKRKVLNMGRLQRVSGALVHCVVGGHEATEDVPLDKDGKQIVDNAIAPAKLITEAAAGERCYIEFEIADAASFSGLTRGIR